MLLMPLARQRLYFFFHHQMHQLQSGLAHELAHPILQQMRNIGHWQDQLHGRVLFGGDPAELLHGSLLFDLVLFLQATLSFFLAEKTTRRPIMPTVESRYFLRFTGHPLVARQQRTLQHPTLLTEAWWNDGLPSRIIVPFAPPTLPGAAHAALPHKFWPEQFKRLGRCRFETYRRYALLPSYEWTRVGQSALIRAQRLSHIESRCARQRW